MKRRLFFVAIVTLLIGAQVQFVALADGDTTTSGNSIVEQIGCDVSTPNSDGSITVSNPCQINDFINLFVYLSKWGMSILAMLATLMMVYGGFQFVIAGGRPSKVDEGKRVILGTLVGTTIALTGYIIINTAFAAISGTKIASQNPFGVVSSVFDNKNNRNIIIQGQTKPLIQPFTGSTPSSGGTTGGTIPSDLAACRKSGSTWDFTCTAGNFQVYCADPATGATPITSIQTKLEAKGCFCGGHDGCYGPNTVKCVRQFQIANALPPSGVVDATTQDRIDNGTTGCATEAATLAAKLPDTELSTSATAGEGCCVVRSGVTDLYCVDGISTRACGALGADSQFINSKCGTAAGTSIRCGFCSDTSSPTVASGVCSNNTSKSCAKNSECPGGRCSASSCFSYVSPYWCSNNTSGGTAPTFNFGACDGRCASCVRTLLPSF